MCYEDQAFSLTPGLNIIIGPSDSGKSAILRALGGWLMYNKIPSTVVCREGTTETAVTITTSSGDIVKRVRSSKVNAYSLNDQYYTAIGSSVPPEVIDTLQIASLAEKGAETLQYSRQSDGPFLLDSGGSSSAKIFGSLSGISIFDTALSELKSDILKVRRNIDALSAQNHGYSIELLSFASLPKVTQLAASARSLLQTTAESLDRLNSLRGLRDQLSSLEALASIELDYDKCTTSMSVIAGKITETLGQLAKLNRLIEVADKMRDFNFNRSKLAQVHDTANTAYQQAILHYEQTRKQLKVCPLCKAAFESVI